MLKSLLIWTKTILLIVQNCLSQYCSVLTPLASFLDIQVFSLMWPLTYHLQGLSLRGCSLALIFPATYPYLCSMVTRRTEFTFLRFHTSPFPHSRRDWPELYQGQVGVARGPHSVSAFGEGAVVKSSLCAILFFLPSTLTFLM